MTITTLDTKTMNAIAEALKDTIAPFTVNECEFVFSHAKPFGAINCMDLVKYQEGVNEHAQAFAQVMKEREENRFLPSAFFPLPERKDIECTITVRPVKVVVDGITYAVFVMPTYSEVAFVYSPAMLYNPQAGKKVEHTGYKIQVHLS